MSWPNDQEPAARSKLVQRRQAQFERDAAEFLSEAHKLDCQGDHAAAIRLAAVLMQKHVEEWEGECRHVPGTDANAADRRAAPATDEVTYAFG